MSTTPLQTVSAASNAVAFGSNVTAGSQIVVIGFVDSASSITSIADTLGNTYSLIKKQANAASPGGTQWPVEIWLGKGAAGGGANTVTGTWSGAGNKIIIAVEVPGLATSPAGTPIGASTTSANPSVGNITPSAAGDLVIACCSNVNNKTITAGSGFTVPANGSKADSGNVVAFEYQVAPNTSAITCAFTALSDDWAGAAVNLAQATANPANSSFAIAQQ